jgi:ubiquinone/menaquinone biosynthesis C-methylase UbiE
MPTEPIVSVNRSRAEAQSAYNRMVRFLYLAGRSFEARRRMEALHVLNVQPGEHVLEIGFGTGNAMMTIARGVGKTGKAFGVDISDRMVQFTQKRLAAVQQVAQTDLRQGDAEQLPFSEHSMDAVYLGFTLELFDTPDIPVVLAEVKRVLRPGGRLVVLAMQQPAHAGWLDRLYVWAHVHYPRYVDCRPIYVREEIEQAGFRITFDEIKRIWGLPVAIVQGIRD